MKKIIIWIVIICVILILSNVCSATSATLITIHFNDKSWNKYVEQQQIRTYAAIHRSCISSINDNKICNNAAKQIYQLELKNKNPVYGFDWSNISDTDKDVAKGK